MAQKSIKKNTVFNALKTVSSIIFPLITFPYISRVILPENVGKVNFGLSIVSYFNLIASLGITTYAIRECSAVREDKKKLCDTASQIWSINIITTVVAYVLLAVTLLSCHKLENYRMLIVIQSLSIVFTALGADWLNQAMEDFKFITIRTVAFQFISIALMFIFVHKPEDYMKYAAISLVSSSGASVVNIWYRRRYCNVRFTRDIEWQKHFAPIMYLFVMILAQTIFNSVDSTMLGLMHGDHEVGIYSTAHKIMNLINQVVASLVWVVMPRMSYYFSENNYDEINKLLRKILNFYLTIGLPCAIGTIMMSEDMIVLIAGREYVGAAPVLRVMMVGFIFSLYGGNFLGNSILLPSKQEKYYMIACCVMAVFNVIANYILIPRLSAVGAAITTALCSVLMLIILELRKDKKIIIANKVNLWGGPVLGCAFITLVCFLCRAITSPWIRFVTTIVLSVVVYFIAQIIFKNSLIVEITNKLENRAIKSGHR